MMDPCWGWSLSGTTPTQPFAPNESTALERLFRQQRTEPVHVALASFPSCAVGNEDLNRMQVALPDSVLIMLSRTYSALALADPALSDSADIDRVEFLTSTGHWLPYDAQDAVLVCDAWRFKRTTVCFIRSGVVYVVALSPEVPCAQQGCMLTKKCRELRLRLADAGKRLGCSRDASSMFA